MNEFLHQVVHVNLQNTSDQVSKNQPLIQEGLTKWETTELPTYVLGNEQPTEVFKGRVVGIVEPSNGEASHLVVAPTVDEYSRDEIRTLVNLRQPSLDYHLISPGKVAGDRIRPIALGLVRRGDEVLVEKGYDIIRDHTFYRFLGGGIEFQEKGEDAVVREFMEELGIEVKVKEYLGTIENIFQFEKRKGHELVMVYELELREEDYQKDSFEKDEQGVQGKAYWIKTKLFKNGALTLHPVESLGLL